MGMTNVAVVLMSVNMLSAAGADPDAQAPEAVVASSGLKGAQVPVGASGGPSLSGAVPQPPAASSAADGMTPDSRALLYGEDDDDDYAANARRNGCGSAGRLKDSVKRTKADNGSVSADCIGDDWRGGLATMAKFCLD